MRNWIACFGLIFLTSMGFAVDGSSAQVRLTPGPLGLNDFVVMVSEKLDIQIDASGLEDRHEVFTISDLGPVSFERARALVFTALYFGGFTLIHDPTRDLYRVMRTRDARDQELPVITAPNPLPDDDSLVTYIMSIKYVTPEQIGRVMRNFMPANSRIIGDQSTHTVLITDSAHNVAKLKQLVERLDTPQAAEQEKAWRAQRSTKDSPPCPEDLMAAGNRPNGIQIALFSLIALVIGFLARGYVIRRIEGGL